MPNATPLDHNALTALAFSLVDSPDRFTYTDDLPILDPKNPSFRPEQPPDIKVYCEPCVVNFCFPTLSPALYPLK